MTETTEQQEFTLIGDDDGHWYVCPADRREEAEAFFEKSRAYWEPGSKHEGEAPEETEWLEQIGGSPSLVRFTGYWIE